MKRSQPLGTGHYLCGEGGGGEKSWGGPGLYFLEKRVGPKYNFTMAGGGSLCVLKRITLTPIHVEDLSLMHCWTKSSESQFTTMKLQRDLLYLITLPTTLSTTVDINIS